MEYTEQQIEDLKKNARAEGKTEGKSEAESAFAERETEIKKTAKDEGKAEAKKEFDDNEKAREKVNAYKGDVDGLIKEFSTETEKDGKKVAPKLVPAQIAPLRALLYSFGENKTVEYSDKDKDGKETTVKSDALKLVRDVLSNFAEAPKGAIKDTKEGAKGDEAKYAEEKAEAEKIVKEFKDKGETITFGQAILKAREKLGRNKGEGDGDGDGE